MKFMFSLIIICVVLGMGWYVARAVGETRGCYLSKERDLNDLAYKLQSFGGDKTMLCTASYELVDALGACLTKADSSLPARLREPLGPMVKKMLGLVRNGGKELKGFQDGHDAVCSEYPDMMFTPPEYLVR